MSRVIKSASGDESRRGPVGVAGPESIRCFYAIVKFTAVAAISPRFPDELNPLIRD